MASPQIGLYFAIGLVTGVLISFLVSTFSPGYKEFAQLSSIKLSATQRMMPMNKDDVVQSLLREASGETKCNCTKEVKCEKVSEITNPLSHKDVDIINQRDENQIKIDHGKEDEHKHNDDDHMAKELYKQVRVLVWVMTQPDSLEKKARHVNITWGKRANKIMFASDTYDKDFPTMPIEVPHGRNHLTAKTMAAFDYVYKHHLNEYDWFMKADDDTYVIMENLRYFLKAYDPRESVFFGHLFKTIVKQGYYSGGGGYVLSHEALRRFGERQDRQCASDNGAEDVEFGLCMEKLGVKTQESIDNMGRTRFHCFNPGTHIGGGYPDWFLKYDKYDGLKKGSDSISDYAVTFHYVSIKEMYNLEFFVYHLRPYGIQNGLQELNIPRVKDIPPEVIKLETGKKKKVPTATLR